MFVSYLRCFSDLMSVTCHLSHIPPGDDGAVGPSGFPGGRETEAACSGKFLLERRSPLPHPPCHLSIPFPLHQLHLPSFYFMLPFSSCSISSPLPRSFLYPLCKAPFFSFFVSFPSGASSLSGEPVVTGRAGWCSAATAGQGAGGGHPGGTEQTPAVHVLHTQIRHGGAAAGEQTTNFITQMCVLWCSGLLCVHIQRLELVPLTAVILFYELKGAEKCHKTQSPVDLPHLSAVTAVMADMSARLLSNKWW